MSHMVLSLLILSANVYAVPTLPKCLNGPRVEKNIGLVHKAAMMGAETRKPTIDHPERKKFSGTGMIKCFNPPAEATIQLTGRNGLVTGVMHSLVPQCNRRTDDQIRECQVTFPLSGDPDRVYRIKPETVSVPGTCYRRDRKNDWAVFELSSAVEGAEYYDVPARGFRVNPNRSGWNVTQVAAVSDNFVPPLPRRPHDEHHTTECQIFRGSIPGIPIQTSCHTGYGASGAGQYLLTNKRYTIVAINSGDFDDGTGPYDHERHFNASAPVEDELLEILNTRLGR